MVSVSRNIVSYNKYLLVITVVVVFVSYCYSHCDFVKTLYSLYWRVQVQVLVLYAFYFWKKNFNREENLHATVVKFCNHPIYVRTVSLPGKMAGWIKMALAWRWASVQATLC